MSCRPVTFDLTSNSTVDIEVDADSSLIQQHVDESRQRSASPEQEQDMSSMFDLSNLDVSQNTTITEPDLDARPRQLPVLLTREQARQVCVALP
jgi:hypothetical protein